MDDRHKPTSSTLSRIFTPAADKPRGYHLTARPGTAVPSPSSHSSSSSLSHSLSVPGPHRSKKSRRFRPEEEKEEGTEHPAPCFRGRDQRGIQNNRRKSEIKRRNFIRGNLKRGESRIGVSVGESTGYQVIEIPDWDDKGGRSLTMEKVGGICDLGIGKSPSPPLPFFL